MNLNRINRHWPVPKNNSLHLIDTMSVYEAEECGLVTAQESEVISIIWERHLKVALEEKGYATKADLQPIPNSEIVKRFRQAETVTAMKK